MLTEDEVGGGAGWVGQDGGAHGVTKCSSRNLCSTLPIVKNRFACESAALLARGLFGRHRSVRLESVHHLFGRSLKRRAQLV